jgi:predicted RNase H-like HicB family nuclease
MSMLYFPAIIERPGSEYCVFFPDLDGCTSAGDTVQEAALNAVEALRGHIALMLADGEPIPEPRSPDAVRTDPDVHEVTRVLIPVELPRKAVRVNITIEQSLLGRIARAAAAAGFTRSGFLAEAARRMIRER